VSLRLNEKELLRELPEDGFPLALLAGGDAPSSSIRDTALTLLRQGQIEVYRGADAAGLPPNEAEAVLASPDNWMVGQGEVWFICTTPEGDAALAADAP
jgi:hypothetical protein